MLFLQQRVSFLEGWLKSTYAAIAAADDAVCQSLENGNTDGTCKTNLRMSKVYNDKPPRERTWYAFSDKDPLVCKEESSMKRKEDMKCVAGSLINVYKDGSILSFLEQILIKFSS